LQQAIEHYREEDNHGTFPEDLGVSTVAWMGPIEWQLGYTDRALRYVNDALDLTRRQDNPFALAYALTHCSWVNELRGDFKSTLTTCEEVVRLSSDRGFPLHDALCKLRGAWARAHLGDTGGAVDRIRAELAAFDAMKFYLFRPSFLGMLCEAEALAGAVDDALVTVGQALQVNPDDLLYGPAALRLRAELRIRSSSSEAHHELAEQDFRKAIELARGMETKSYELRATTSLARLLERRGRCDEARAMLAEIYNWFTEGFDTLPLKEAKVLLDELSG
jgi:ATP/maltotriose-dependent transcriptional regulator MalT